MMPVRSTWVLAIIYCEGDVTTLVSDHRPASATVGYLESSESGLWARCETQSESAAGSARLRVGCIWAVGAGR